MKITHDKGFTLIEVLITMAIFAILATMAAPSFSAMIKNQNLNKSVRELNLMFSDARAKATLERRTVTVELNSSLTNTVNQLNWEPVGETTLKSGSPTNIKFLPTGMIDSSTDMVFEICRGSTGSESKKITISRMGNIQAVVGGTC